MSHVVRDYSRTLLWKFDNRLAKPKLEREFRKLEASAQRELRAEGWRGLAEYERSLDLRYRGQGYELNVPATKNVVTNFHEEHQRRYGYHHPGRQIELVTVRLRATMRTPPLRRQPEAKVAQTLRTKESQVTPLERTPVYFRDKAVTTPVFERADLIFGRTLMGPAVITEYSATTVIPPGNKFWVDTAENLIINMKMRR